MNILVGVHVEGDWNPGISAAKISLNDKTIHHIRDLSRGLRQGQIIQVFDSTPDLGTSDLDLDNNPVRNIDTLLEEESQQAVFGMLSDEGRSEVVQLNVDKTDFWWSGVFKHTDVHWETAMIPLSILPEPAKATTLATPELPDYNVPEKDLILTEEIIASGANQGLSSREIEKLLLKKTTKAHLVRCILHLIERERI